MKRTLDVRLILVALAAALVVAACAGQRSSSSGPGSILPPASETPAGAPQSAPTPTPATAPLATNPQLNGPSLASAPPSAASPPSPSPSSAFAFAAHIPAGTLYVCARSADGPQTPIEYEAKVRDLCVRHPEMGVCQYGRDSCRASGGRVYDASGVEITKAIEAEYDRKVMRVRFRS